MKNFYTDPAKMPTVAKQAFAVLQKGGYIKGFTDQYKRVMDKDHNPQFNITRQNFEILLESEMIKQVGLIYKINDKHKLID